MIDYLYGPVQHDAFFKKYASKKFLKGTSNLSRDFEMILTRCSFNGSPRMGEATRPRISRWSPSITPIELEEQATMSAPLNINSLPKYVHTLMHSSDECHPSISSLLIHRRFWGYTGSRPGPRLFFHTSFSHDSAGQHAGLNDVRQMWPAESHDAYWSALMACTEMSAR